MRAKAIGSIILGLLILLNTSIFTPAQASGEISLESAIQTALSNNKELKLYDDKITYAKQRYDLAYAKSFSAMAKGWDDDAELISNKKEELLYPLQRKNQIDQLVWEKQNKADSLESDVTKAYYEILNKNTLITLREKAVKRLQNELEVKKKQVKGGVEVQTTVTNLQISINQEQQKVNNLIRERDVQIIKLNGLLGFELSSSINLKKVNIPINSIDNINIENAVESQSLNNHDILKAQKDLEEIRLEYDIVKKYSYKPDSNGIEEIEDRMLDAEYALEEIKKDVSLKVRTDFNTLLNLRDDIEINKLECEKAKKLSQAASAKYKLGQITLVIMKR
ncbi:TolC family protein [Ruminiclostridium josui]|uniref:TolC family protein n=1 Tax=Ruminiclostridium josui TaxID=1499 RepID=UPI0006D26D57|nr:TolC family protein [Ruminiclostridium josui]